MYDSLDAKSADDRSPEDVCGRSNGVRIRHVFSGYWHKIYTGPGKKELCLADLIRCHQDRDRLLRERKRISWHMWLRRPCYLPVLLASPIGLTGALLLATLNIFFGVPLLSTTMATALLGLMVARAFIRYGINSEPRMLSVTEVWLSALFDHLLYRNKKDRERLEIIDGQLTRTDQLHPSLRPLLACFCGLVTANNWKVDDYRREGSSVAEAMQRGHMSQAEVDARLLPFWTALYKIEVDLEKAARLMDKFSIMLVHGRTGTEVLITEGTLISLLSEIHQAIKLVSRGPKPTGLPTAPA